VLGLNGSSHWQGWHLAQNVLTAIARGMSIPKGAINTRL
jgi:hypothetical protein